MTKRSSFIVVIAFILVLLPVMDSAAATIVVRARGVAGNEQLRLEVGGITVQTFTLSTSLNDYTATTNNTGAINVRFINDNFIRDVQVDYIDVNGERRQAENQGTNTGVYQNYKCGGSYSEWLHCNGYIAFGNVGSGSTPAPTNAPTPTPTNTTSTTTTTSAGSGQGHGWLSARAIINSGTSSSTTSVPPGSTTTTTTTTTSINPGSTGTIYLGAGHGFLAYIHVNTGMAMVRSFGFTITYPASQIAYHSAKELIPGCNLSIDSGTAGTLKITGYSVNGIQGSNDLILVEIDGQAISTGQGIISLTVDTLTDLNGNTIGILSGTGIQFISQWVTTSSGGGTSSTTTSAARSSTTGIIR